MYMQKATADHKKEEENMIIHYRASGKDRKKLAEIVAKEIGVDAIYQGAPTFSYQMDYFTVDREGALVFDDELTGDESERVLDRIAAAGFTPDEGEDEMEEKSIDLAEVAAGTMSRKAYMKKWRGLTDDEVQDELEQMALEKQYIDEVAMPMPDQQNQQESFEEPIEDEPIEDIDAVEEDE